MNSAELAKRILDCISDGYDDEEYREEAEAGLYNELLQFNSDNIIQNSLIALCKRVEELEM